MEFNFTLEMLTKYNAVIYSEVDGDTHGVTDAIIINFDNKDVMRFENPSCISKYDL